MNGNLPGIVVTKHRKHVVGSADGKEHKMLALGTHERAEHGILIQMEPVFPVARSQPW